MRLFLCCEKSFKALTSCARTIGRMMFARICLFRAGKEHAEANDTEEMRSDGISARIIAFNCLSYSTTTLKSKTFTVALLHAAVHFQYAELRIRTCEKIHFAFLSTTSVRTPTQPAYSRI